MVAATPGASLRTIARAAGVSVGTARDVRERLRLGQAPVPVPRGDRAPGPPACDDPGFADARADPRVALPRRSGREAEPIVAMLRRDPSLRFTEVGRLFLRLLPAHPLDSESWERFVTGIPAHCAESVAQLARSHAEDWLRLARAIENPAGRGTPRPAQSPGCGESGSGARPQRG